MDIEFEYNDTRIDYCEITDYLEKKDIFTINQYEEDDISNSMCEYPDFHQIVHLNVSNINWEEIFKIVNTFFKRKYIIIDKQFGISKSKQVIAKCILQKTLDLDNKDIIFSTNDFIDHVGHFDFLAVFT